MFGPRTTSVFSASARCHGHDEGSAVVDLVGLTDLDPTIRQRDLSGKGAGGGHQRADQVYLGVRGAGSLREVPVEGAQADPLADRRTALPDTGAAAVLHDPDAGAPQGGQVARFSQLHGHRPGAGVEQGVNRHSLPFEQLCEAGDILVGTVGAAADAHLVNLRARPVGDLFHVARGWVDGDQRLQLREVDANFVRVTGPLVGRHGFVVATAATALQILAGSVVTGKDRGRGPHLRAHVGDGCAFGERKAGRTRSGVLEYLALATLDADDGEHLQDHVHGGDAPAEFTLELDLDDLRHGDLVLAAGHGQRNVVTAGAEIDGTHPASVDRMAVRTNTGHSRLDEILDVEKVTDTRAWRRENDAELLGNRPQILVIVRIAKPHLHHAVIDEVDRQGLDPFDTHRLELKHAHGAGCILRKRLVDAQRDHLARLRQGPAAYLVLGEDLLGQIHGCHGGSPPYQSVYL